MELQPISKEEWQYWKSSPATQLFLNALYFKREQIKEGIAEGKSSSEREDCIAIGQTQAYLDAIEYAVKEFEYLNRDSNNPEEEESNVA